MLKVATWNCQKGLDRNWPAVEALDADVLTVQECGPQACEQARETGWACEYAEGAWGKGLIVLARPPFGIEVREESERYAISAVISGPQRFRFVGFWAMTPKDAGYSYTRQATRVIEGLPDDGLPTVVAGDFNASKSAQHLANVRRLGDRGLVSAYHAFHGAAHEEVEGHPTSHYLWQESRPYHMDFVFVPKAWAIERVQVGTFADYSMPGGMSDHVPVIVDVVQAELSGLGS
jgi:endonuclease/exonuclease/phosphatase family metal-dependent hydrolase